MSINAKNVAVVALIALGAVAVAYRIDPVKKLITG